MKPSSRKSFLRRLLGQQRGSVTPLFLLSFTAILGTTMGGVDLVRYNVVQNRLQSALDGATLSAGRNLQNRQMSNMNDSDSPDYLSWQEDAFGYFRANMPDSYLGSTIEPEDLKITYSDTPLEENGYTTGQFVAMTVEGTLPLISTGFLDVSSMTVRAKNQAVRHTPADLELVMALDNTGSMDGSKMIQLKKAARSLNDILSDARAEKTSDGTDRDITIGLVPFSDTVNVGNTEYTRNWLSRDLPIPQIGDINDPAEKGSLRHTWWGCIAEPLPKEWGETEDNKQVDDLPAQAWRPGDRVFMPLHLRYSFNLSRNTLDLNNNDVIQTTPTPPVYREHPNADPDERDRRVDAVVNNDKRSFTIYSAGNPTNCVKSRKTLFLSDDEDTVKDAIDKMTADGNTLVPIGLLWAWRMVNPTWEGAWDGSDKPQPTNTKNLRKVIVLLTDGQNEPGGARGLSSDERRSAFEIEYQVKRGSNPIRTETYKTNNNGTQTSVSTQNSMSSLRMRDPANQSDTSRSIGWGNYSSIGTGSVDNYLKALCENVKDDGNAIKIYTVTLGNVGDSVEEMMNDCSSGAGYYYNTKSADNLTKVFESIAAAMVELRLTK